MRYDLLVYSCCRQPNLGALMQFGGFAAVSGRIVTPAHPGCCCEGARISGRQEGGRDAGAARHSMAQHSNTMLWWERSH